MPKITIEELNAEAERLSATGGDDGSELFAELKRSTNWSDSKIRKFVNLAKDIEVLAERTKEK